VVEAKNQAESLIHSTEKSLAEHGDKIAQPEKDAVTDAITGLRTELEGEDVELIKAKTNDLMQAAMKIGEAIYKAQSDSETETAEADAARDAAQDARKEGKKKPKDDVEDAEFKEVKDDKKKAG
jgi:molecular chaperone DnaK